MKILLINPYNPDYLSSMIVHGLITIGEDVTEYNYLDYMRVKYKDKIDTSKFWGKGYSYTFLLDDDKKQVDKKLIEDQIADHYYDLIIYTFIWCETACLDLVLKTYKPGEIFIVDGEDYPIYHNILSERPKNTIYFKRELLVNNESFGCNLRLFPISYAFPKEKFQKRNPQKTIPFVNDCSYGSYYTLQKQI